MEPNNAENTMTRLSIMGPQAPPDMSASRRSLATKAVKKGVPTAVFYCEGNFGQIDGKTANGLVRYSQAYRILSVIDTRLKGRDSGQVLDNVSNAIPILEDIEAAVAREASIPDTLIYGMAMDAVPPQFCCGELERVIVAASHGDDPDVILIEGQGALSHPAFCTSAFILRGSQPHVVVLQHAPKSAHRCDFPAMPMPGSKSEIALIEAFADTRMIGITLNHEAMTDAEVDRAIDSLSRDLGIPVTDALTRPEVHLSDMVVAAFPQRRSVPLAAAE